MNKVIFLILLLALFLRLYNIEKLATFTGEEGRDYAIVAKIVKGQDFTLLGPTIGPYNNISQVYLGPAYYYLIALPLAIFNLDPIGPSVAIALFSVLTVFIVYKIGTTFFDKFTGVVAALLYATNPFLIEIGRSSNPAYYAPIFAAILTYALLATFIAKKQKYFVLAGVCLGFLVQFHYTTLISAVMILVLMIATKPRLKIKYITAGILSGLIVISPLLLFELRNEFFITKSITAQVSYAANYGSSSKNLLFIPETIYQLFSTFVANNRLLSIVAIAAVLICLKNRLLFFLASWVILNTIAIYFYYGPYVPHYFATSIIPLLVLTAAGLSRINKVFKIGTMILIVITTINIVSLDLNRDHGYSMPAGWNLEGVKIASNIILSDVDKNSKFNVAATLDGDSRAMPYRYFFQNAGAVPQPVENYADLDILYLVAKDDKQAIKSYTVWEVAAFAPFTVVGEWNIQNDVRLFKLKKNK